MRIHYSPLVNISFPCCSWLINEGNLGCYIQQLSPEVGVQVRAMITSDIRCSYCSLAAWSFIAMYDKLLPEVVS